MNDNEQRDQLARELFIADNSNQPREASIVDWEWFEATDKQRGQLEHYKNMAAGMITAGYAKVDPADEVAVDKVARVLTLSDGWLSVSHPSPRHQMELRKRAHAILTVLHEPEAEAAEFGIDECNGSGRCDVSKHVHGCYSDLGRCDEPAEHETTR